MELWWKYGVYKSLPLDGLTTIDEINTKDKDDFYWYDTLDDAKACEDLIVDGIIAQGSKCVVTSIYINNPSYNGDGIIFKF